MLDVNFFKNPRFTAASSGIALIFFAMFGTLFLLTQYFQFVMGYSALRTGVALLPIAIAILVVAPRSARLVERVGTKLVVATGLALAAVALVSFTAVPAQHINYTTDMLWRLVILATGMGLVMAPATESIMGSLPRSKAGAGSAVNDTTRQVGGALGVALIGNVMTSTYATDVGRSITGPVFTQPPGISPVRNRAWASHSNWPRKRQARCTPTSCTRPAAHSCTACTTPSSSARSQRPSVHSSSLSGYRRSPGPQRRSRNKTPTSRARGSGKVREACRRRRSPVPIPSAGAGAPRTLAQMDASKGENPVSDAPVSSSGSECGCNSGSRRAQYQRMTKHPRRRRRVVVKREAVGEFTP
jgi:hypothetical protein